MARATPTVADGILYFSYATVIPEDLSSLVNDHYEPVRGSPIIRCHGAGYWNSMQ